MPQTLTPLWPVHLCLPALFFSPKCMCIALWNFTIAFSCSVQQNTHWHHCQLEIVHRTDMYKAKKNKSYVSKLPRACVFWCAFDSAKFRVWIFFGLLNFFPVFYELACQNIQEKIWQTQWNTLNNRLVRLCVLSCILFIQNQVPYFKAVNDSDLTRLLLRKKKKTLLKKIRI